MSVVQSKGVAAPQYDHTRCDLVTEVNRDWVAGRQVDQERDRDDSDAQGRLLPYVDLGGAMVNAALFNEESEFAAAGQQPGCQTASVRPGRHHHIGQLRSRGRMAESGRGDKDFHCARRSVPTLPSPTASHDNRPVRAFAAIRIRSFGPVFRYESCGLNDACILCTRGPDFPLAGTVREP